MACNSEPQTMEALRGRRAAVVLFSHYPSDPRPRRSAEALVEAGMQVDVISLRQDDGEPLRETCNGVRVLRVPLKHWRGGKLAYLFQYSSFLMTAYLALAFRSTMRRYALVHVHNMPDVLVFSALVPKLLGARVILDLHDPMPELMMSIFGMHEDSFAVRLLRRLEKWSIAFADLVLTPNIAFRNLFSARSCRSGKLQVLMNSPDESIFRLREPDSQPIAGRDSKKPFVIMYHGALVARHGLDIAVQAFRLAKERGANVQMRIFGRPTPFLEQVLRQIKQLGLEDSVLYLGPRRLEQIPEEIDACDVGVIPNRRCAFIELNMPTRIFEYLSRGKPVIAPRTSGIRDYFGEDDLLFFEPDNPADLADKFQGLCCDSRSVYETVKRGQAVYLAHRWSVERQKFLDLVAALIAPSGGRSEYEAVPSVKSSEL